LISLLFDCLQIGQELPPHYMPRPGDIISLTLRPDRNVYNKYILINPDNENDLRGDWKIKNEIYSMSIINFGVRIDNEKWLFIYWGHDPTYTTQD
jgi:hypothetical protein